MIRAQDDGGVISLISQQIRQGDPFALRCERKIRWKTMELKPYVNVFMTDAETVDVAGQHWFNPRYDSGHDSDCGCCNTMTGEPTMSGVCSSSKRHRARARRARLRLWVVREANKNLKAFLHAAFCTRSDADVPPAYRPAVWGLVGIGCLLKTIGDYLGAVYTKEEWPVFHENMTLRNNVEPYSRSHSSDEEERDALLANYEEAHEALRDYHDPQLEWIASLEEQMR